jgi:hypothetical protein
MNESIEQFRQNIKSVKDIDKIYILLNERFPLIDSSELLRAQIVMAVSAFDCYIHDVVRLGMLETFNGSRIASTSFSKFTLSINSLQRILNSSSKAEQNLFLESEIRSINSSDSFQSPKSIEYALQLINIKNIWTQLSQKLSIPTNDIRDELGLIINRRNKIAHESDYDFINGAKNSIDRNTVTQTIDFIEKLCEGIYEIL